MTTATALNNQSVRDRTHHAYWYAAGYADATGTDDRSHAFSEYVRKEAHDYYVDQSRTFLPSLTEQWLNFCAAEGGGPTTATTKCLELTPSEAETLRRFIDENLRGTAGERSQLWQIHNRLSSTGDGGEQ